MNKLKKVLKNSKRAVLLYHIDTDGVCSAKLMSEALQRLNIQVVNYFPTTPKLLNSNDFQKGINRSDADLIIIVDVEVRENTSLVKNNKDKNIIVMDHHSIDEIPKHDNIIYINPKLEGVKDYTPAAKIVYDTINQIIDISDLDWVAVVGVIGDSAGNVFPDFVKKIMKKYKVKIGKDKKHFFDSFFGTLSNMINSGKIVKGNDGASTALKLLQDTKTPNEFYEHAYKLRDWNNKIEDYLERVKLDFEKEKEKVEGLDLYFFSFKPEFTIGSVLSTIIAFEKPHNTIIMFSKKNGVTTINYRRQDKKYDMGLLAKNSVKGLLRAGGGGHVPAAGGHIQTKDLNALKSNIIKEYKKLIKK